MTHKIFIISIIIGILFVSFGCRKDNPVESQEDQSDFIGTVTDTSGVAIDSVAVHFMTHFDRLFPKYRYPIINPTTRIGFAIPSDGFVTLLVYRYGTNEIIDTLVNDSMAAGYQSVEFDSKSLTNGLYYFVIYLDKKLFGRQNMMLYINNIPELIQTSPVTYTDRNGQFKLPPSVFGAGVKLFTSLNDPSIIDTITITNTIDLVLYKQGYQPYVQQLTIDTAGVYNGKFALSR